MRRWNCEKTLVFGGGCNCELTEVHLLLLACCFLLAALAAVIHARAALTYMHLCQQTRHETFGTHHAGS
jgi:hypothetical protein